MLLFQVSGFTQLCCCFRFQVSPITCLSVFDRKSVLLHIAFTKEALPRGPVSGKDLKRLKRLKGLKKLKILLFLKSSKV